MNQPLQSFWDQRYAAEDYVYGTVPNDFLVQQASTLPPGLPVLCLADGEGRNSVWLAQQGFEVTAVDISERGLAKARALAQQAGVHIETVQADLKAYPLGEQRWGAIVSIFLHLPPALRREVHLRSLQALVPGGVFLYEAYSSRQPEYGTGGPKELPLLPALPDLLAELAPALEASGDGASAVCARLLHSASLERPVHEGPLHHGQGHVNQMVVQRLA